MLLGEGGRWKAHEISRRLNKNYHSIGQAINRMVVTGCLVRFPKIDGQARNRYGVTKDCRVPNGVTLAEVMGAGVREGDA